MVPSAQTPGSLTLEFFKALADESRLRIVAMLAEREHSVQEIARRLNLREPTISHHLAILRELELVAVRAEGTVRWYRLNDGVLRKFKSEVFSPENLARIASTDTADSWEAKVLANFLDGERLIKIPDTRRKRWAVLRWMGAKFQADVSYSEAQVNAIIKRHHEDAAFIRREMIGEKIFARENGIYRLRPQSEWSEAPR
ncbi:MAG TPA: metalloregulator ArsR/SmtB family transcription factor [Candidatus Binataceae bacterium]|nr:metalloregulator ArsR/SmtB family transcription factor [Candidatus Binataceae bacterium]